MPGEYTIAGGLTDAQRLARQAHVMAGATQRFLDGVGLTTGWSCLDVGCGDGQVTIAMARAAGAFDLAYARLVLSHLVDPSAVVRGMASEVRPGGVVAVEDLFTGTLRSEPPAPALDRLQDVYSATVRFHGGDPTIGPRLPALLAAAGLTDVCEATVANRMETIDDKLFLAQLVRNMRASILEAGAATDADIDALEADVAAAARDPATAFFQARIHQVSGRRPAG